MGPVGDNVMREAPARLAILLAVLGACSSSGGNGRIGGGSNAPWISSGGSGVNPVTAVVQISACGIHGWFACEGTSGCCPVGDDCCESGPNKGDCAPDCNAVYVSGCTGETPTHCGTWCCPGDCDPTGKICDQSTCGDPNDPACGGTGDDGGLNGGNDGGTSGGDDGGTTSQGDDAGGSNGGGSGDDGGGSSTDTGGCDNDAGDCSGCSVAATAPSWPSRSVLSSVLAVIALLVALRPRRHRQSRCSAEGAGQHVIRVQKGQRK
jgi:hypothetical protein